MKTGSEIINEVLEIVEMNAASFAVSIGKSPQNIYDVVNGKVKKVSLELATLITQKYPQFNINYLRKGEGEIISPIAAVQDSTVNDLAIGLILDEIASLRAKSNGTLYTDEKDALLRKISQLGKQG